MATNWNIRPYYDDFDAAKNFVHVLFRPGVPIQARELTQAQTILKKQIESFGDHIFKKGSKVLGGGITFRDNVATIEITPTLSTLQSAINAGSLPQAPSALESLVGTVVTGLRTGIKARVFGFKASSATSEPHLLFVQYVAPGKVPGGSAVLRKFSAAYPEQIETKLADNPTLTRVYATVCKDGGVAAVASCIGGTYYVDGSFVTVEPTSHVLASTNDADSLTISAKIGFTVVSNVVTAADDVSLLDNAEGSSAFGSSGAHRHQISLELSSRSLTSPEDQEFIELVRVVDSRVTRNLSDQPQYAALMDTLARRTFDESGHYSVSQFSASKKDAADRSNYNLVVSAGKAYVSGYEAQTLVPTTLEIPRARDTLTRANFQIPMANDISVTVHGDTPLSATDANFGASGLIRFCEMSVADYYAGTAKWDDELIGYAYASSIDIANSKIYFSMYVPVTRLTVDTITGVDTNTYLFAADPTTTDWSNNAPLGHVVTAYNRTAVNYIVVSGVNITGATTVYTESGTAIAVSAIQVKSFSGAELTIITPCSADAPNNAYFKAFRIVPQNFPSGINQLRWYTGLTVKTTRDGAGGILDNNYSMMVHNAGTDLYSSTDYNDTQPTAKARKTQNITLWTRAQNAVATATPCKFGFNADDYWVYLEPEVRGVLCVLESKDANAPTGDVLTFTAVTSETQPYFPLGCKLTGQTSGATAYVFRANVASLGADEKTGSANTVEVVRVDGTFVASELVTASVYNDTTDAWVTYSRTLAASSFYTKTKSIDITSRYNIVTGQDSLFFGIGRLVPKAGSTKPLKAISVLFENWYVTTQRDYCSVDSYVGYANNVATDTTFSIIDAGEIALGTDLRDAIDFRRSVGFVWRTFTGTTNTKTRYSVTATKSQYKLITENTGTSLNFPELNVPFTTDLVHYVPRADAVVLTKDAEMKLIKGVSSLRPTVPLVPADTMKLFEVYHPAYTRFLDDIVVDVMDNRRYTMKDIGQLERRIENVEDAVALNSLELQALKDELPDIVIEDVAFQRLKTGIFTDGFTDYSRADISDPEFSASINAQWNNLLPGVVVDNFSLEYKSSGSSNVTIADGKATLAYTEVVLLEQKKFSTHVKINPYDNWPWVGNITLTPSRDTWVDTTKTITSYSVIEDDGTVTIVTTPNLFTKLIKPVVTNRTNIASMWEVSSPATLTWNTQQLAANLSGWTQTRDDQDWVTPSDVVFGVAGNGSTVDLGTNNVFVRPVTVVSSTKTTTSYKQTFNETSRIVKDAMKMRAVAITFVVRQMKANTTVSVFFDGVDLTAKCRQAINNNINVGVKTTAGLKSDANGLLVAVCTVPGGTFATGDKVLTVKDADGTTAASAIFSAYGTVETLKGTVVAAANTSSRTQEISRVAITGWQYVDPIAQTFLPEGDLFLSSLDLWFYAVEGGTKRYQNVDELSDIATEWGIATNNSLAWNVFPPTGVNESFYTASTKINKKKFPTYAEWLAVLQEEWQKQITVGQFIEVSIVETDNGYPTKNVIPGSIVTMYPGAITNGFAVNRAYGDTTGAQKSTAVFDAPVFLRGGIEYALVLKTPSSLSSVWVAKMGDKSLDTMERITSQPALGSFFLSQNGSTWSAEQTTDLKFVLRRCEFEATGTLIAATPLAREMYNIGAHRRGSCLKTTSGSNVVRVFHAGHGLPVGAKAEIWNVNATDTGVFHGIPLSELNSNNSSEILSRVLHTITARTDDYYEFQTTTNADTTGVGGRNVISTGCPQYGTLRVDANQIIPTNTKAEFSYKIVSGQSLGGSETPFVQSSAYISGAVNEEIDLEFPALIANENNASGVAGFTGKFVLSTTNSKVSPIISLDPLSLFTERKVMGATSAAPLSVYISKAVQLNDLSKALRISFDYILPKECTVKVFYALAYSSGWSDWIETTSIVSSRDVKSWQAYTAQHDSLGSFSAFQVRMEFYSTNEAKYPRVRNARYIATVL